MIFRRKGLFGMSDRYPFALKPLPYAQEALEPYLDAKVVYFHHEKHQQAYVDNLNKALQKYPAYQDWSLRALVLHADRFPQAIRTEIYNNAGGVFNHELYFDCMTPEKDMQPGPNMAAAIENQFGSYEKWKEKMQDSAVSVFGSGWAWLLADRRRQLRIMKTANQNVPMLSAFQPLLLVDVWEHAYYLQYQNRRAEYVENWFRLINWEYVEKRYLDSPCFVC
jgi:Fe-Mn family superoxide dismutase